MRTPAPLTPIAALLSLALALLSSAPAMAHCDGMDGPVVNPAQKALASGDVNLVAVRRLGVEAKDLADTYVFETLVRVHRAGEGAPYTGLKPAGRDLGPAIPLAHQALSTGKVDALVKLLTDETRQGLIESSSTQRRPRSSRLRMSKPGVITSGPMPMRLQVSPSVLTSTTSERCMCRIQPR